MFSEEELEEILKTSKTFKEAASRLGYNGCNGKLINKIRKIAEERNIQATYIQKEKRKRIEEYIGEKSGYLEVIKVKDGILYCKCHYCNKEELHPVHISNWGRTKACGCLKNERFREGHYEDLTKQTFKYFKPIDINKEYSEKYDKTYWNCLCLSCNKNIIPVWAWDLKRESRSSCGCKGRVKSKGEEKIAQILNEYNIKFYPEFTFKDLYTSKGHPYRFDFAIIDDDENPTCLIEYNGSQHYRGGFYESLESIQERDTIKKEYCTKNNIPLIEIPYTDYDKIDINYLLNKFNEVKK